MGGCKKIQPTGQKDVFGQISFAMFFFSSTIHGDPSTESEKRRHRSKAMNFFFLTNPKPVVKKLHIISSEKNKLYKIINQLILAQL